MRVATVGGTRFEIPHRNVMAWWEEKYPNIEVAFTTADWGSTVERAMAELSAGTGAYDVVFIDWIVIQAMIEANWLRPLDDLIYSTDPEVGVPNYPDAFDATKLYMGMRDGKTYAMPFDFNCQMTYYREDVFNEVGIKVPEDIETWDACLETAKKLHEYNPDYKVGFTMKPPWWTVTWFTEHLFSQGGIIYDEDFMPQLTSPEAKAAMEFALEFYKYAPPEVLNWEDAEIAEAMKAGVVVFSPCTWGGAAVTSPAFNPFADVTKLARVPKGPGGKNWQIEVAGYGGEMGGAGYAIPVVSKRPDLSWKFIRFVVDLKPYPDEKTLKYLEGGAQPTKRDVLGDSGWQAQFPLLKGLSDNGPYAQFKWMQVPEFPEIAEEMGKEIGDVFTGVKSIDDGLKAMNDSTYKIFQRSGRYD